MISYPPPPAPKNKKSAAAQQARAKEVAPEELDSAPDNDDGDRAAELSELRASVRALTRGQALLELGLDGFIRYVSEPFSSLSGFLPPELMGRHFSMLFDPAMFARPEYREFWADLAAGKVRSDVLKQLSKYGRELWVRASFLPVVDAQGSVYKVLVSFVDVTEERAREGDARAQLDALYRVAAVAEFDLEGTLLSANKNLLDLLGYRLDELSGKHHETIAAPDQGGAWGELVEGKVQVGRYKLRAKSGRDIWVHAVYSPLLDANRKPSKVLFVAGDNSEAELKAADYRGQVEAISRSHGVLELSLDGTIRSSNALYQQMFGYRADELVGRHHSMVVDPQQRDSGEQQRMWSELASGRHQSGRFRRVGQGGRELWVEASFNPILDPDGKPFKIVAHVTDVSERVKEELVHARNASLIESAPTAMMFADKGGVIRYINPACIQLCRELEAQLPVRPEQVVGSNVEIFYRSAGGSLVEGSQARTQLSKLGGETLSVTTRPSFDDEGNHIGTMASLEHVTERLYATQTASHYAQSLAAASEELSAVAKQMTANSEQTTNQANLVAEASEQVTSNVTSVAASAEQMSSTVREIAKNAHDAARVATAAVRAADETNKNVAQLGESSMEIGKVIKVITSIAQQTNLLALNATIEAARAGEAGKGFAVVANEVKELAKQTAAATEDISQKIEAIQNDTKGAVGAIQHIGRIIGQINDFQNTIASAVEQQAATTNEIARNASEAARGSLQISGNIGSVSVAARNTSEGAANTLASAEELSRVAGELRALIDTIEL